jgi:hypothetical protein
MKSPLHITPFSIQIEEEILSDLRDRIRNTRWPGNGTACSRRIAHAELRCLKTVPGLGPAPRRSALRKNRCLARAEKTVKLTQAVLAKEEPRLAPMKYWEIIVDNLSKAGWSWSCVSAVDSNGRTIWIADAHRDHRKRIIVRADEKLTAFVELESAIRAVSL